MTKAIANIAILVPIIVPSSLYSQISIIALENNTTNSRPICQMINCATRLSNGLRKYFFLSMNKAIATIRISIDRIVSGSSVSACIGPLESACVTKRNSKYEMETINNSVFVHFIRTSISWRVCSHDKSNSRGAYCQV